MVFLVIFLLITSQVHGRDFSISSLAEMTQEELQNVPPHLLKSAIEELRSHNQSLRSEYEQIKRLNALMCARLESLQRSCAANLFIQPEAGLGSAGCGLQVKKLELKVELEKTEGKHFILQANTLYETQIFTNDNIVTFESNNRQLRLPRFRDLTNLNIVTVDPESKKIAGKGYERLVRPKNLRLIGIKLRATDAEGNVSVYKLLGETKLALPDSQDRSYYRIDPSAILTLGQEKKCQVSMEELNRFVIESKEML